MSKKIFVLTFPKQIKIPYNEGTHLTYLTPQNNLVVTQQAKQTHTLKYTWDPQNLCMSKNTVCKFITTQIQLWCKKISTHKKQSNKTRTPKIIS